ncbi:MAG: ABC transporter substrate-binding protein [Bacillota bacterium]|nr:ABC transporter substrate-binding protein [Bacillota bacterium]
MNRKIAFVLTTVLIFCLCGCKGKKEVNAGTNFPGFDSSIETGGTISAYMLRPDTLNPLLTKIDTNRMALSLIFDPLFCIDKTFTASPRLATGYDISGGGQTVTVYLRNDVTWHDGSPFSADDVIYTVDNILNEKNGSYYYPAMHELINSVRSSGKFTVIFNLNYADSGAVNLFTFPILKKHSGIMSDYFSTYSPLGTGAFKLNEYSGETAMTLVKNPGWKCGYAYIDGVNINILPDTDTVYSAFNSGLIDFAKINWENAGKFSINKNITYNTLYTTNYTFVGLNTQNELLKNSGVRRILSYISGRKEIVGTLLNDYACATDLPIHPKYAHFLASTPASDLESVMAGTGCSLNDKGTMIFCDGSTGKSSPLSFTLLVNEENSKRCSVAEYFSQAAADSGITIHLKKVSYENYISLIGNGEFDMYIGQTILSGDNNLTPFIGTNGYSNYGKYSNSESDSLLNELLTSKDEPSRNEVLTKLQKKFREDMPYIPLYFENEMMVYNSKKLGNITPQMANNFFEFIKSCCVNK